MSLVLQSGEPLITRSRNNCQRYSYTNQETAEQIEEKGIDTLQNKSFFPTLNSEFMPLISFDTNGSSLRRSTHQDPAYNRVTLYSYTSSNRDIEKPLEVFHNLPLVLPALEGSLMRGYHLPWRNLSFLQLQIFWILQHIKFWRKSICWKLVKQWWSKWFHQNLSSLDFFFFFFFFFCWNLCFENNFLRTYCNI